MVVATSTVSSGRSPSSTVPKHTSLSLRQKDASPNPSRRPLTPSERDNAAVTRRPPAKEISSRYLSSHTSPSSITSTSYSSNTTTSSSSYSSSSRRFPSPVPNYRPSTPPSFPQSASARRSYSVDRTRPSTPRVDSRGGGGGVVSEMSNAGRALCTTTRCLSVSFQGESFFYQTSKAKPPCPVPTRKQPTPERRRASTLTRNSTPRTGEKSSDQHHCWPATRSRQSNLLTKSLDCSSDKNTILSTTQLLRQSMLFEDGSRRPSLDGADLLISSDTDSLSSGSNPGTPELRFPTLAPASPRLLGMPARIRQETNSRLRSLPHHGTPLCSSSSKSSIPLKTPHVRRSPADSPMPPPPPRSASSPLRGPVRPSSPSKAAGSPWRGTASPSRGRGISILSISSSRDQPPNASSITSFAAELRRSKKGESPIEAAHMLRVLYNKHLHWRHVNARANATLLVQRVCAEKKMYNAWITSSKLYDLVAVEKIKLQLLTQHLKQAIILKGQMIYLEEWLNLERDHSCSLSGAIEALKATTLHLPVVNGARAELKDVKDAMGSAVDVMQAMGASICSLLSKVERASSLVSQLSEVVARERELIHQSRYLLSTVAALHVKQCSLRGQFLQLKYRPRFVQL